MDETMKLLVRSHRRALAQYRRTNSVQALDALVKITEAMNAEMVVYLGDDQYVDASAPEHPRIRIVPASELSSKSLRAQDYVDAEEGDDG